MPAPWSSRAASDRSSRDDWACPGCEAFEGRNIHYRVRDAAQYHGKKLAIFGGGDSALDWVIDFAGKAAAITLVHRRAEFKAAPASVAKMRALADAGQLRYIEGLADSLRHRCATISRESM